MKLLCIQFFLLYTNLVLGQIELPEIFSDNMVLQQKSVSTIWGRAEAGLPIHVQTSWDTEKYSDITNANGKWFIKLKTPKAGGPYTIFVNDTTIKNVLIGEVWLCSGQSNMRFMLKHAANATEELPKSLLPNLRLFNMQGNPYPDNRIFQKEDLTRCQPDKYYNKTTWQACTPISAAEFSAVAYFFGKILSQKLKVPIGLILNAIGGSPTESWISRKSLESDTTLKQILDDWQSNEMVHPWCRSRVLKNLSGFNPNDKEKLFELKHPYQPSFLFDAGIKPLIPFNIRGVIWYQGESNAHNPTLHERLLRSLIRDWRNEWELGDFPFLYVQLPGMSTINGYPADSWPEFREGQARVLGEPNTGMVVTIDIGNPVDVHPKNKHDVGERLTRVALKKTYKQDLVDSGPVIKSIVPQGQTLRILYINTGDGLNTRDGKDLVGFELISRSGVRLPANATIEGEEIVLSHPKIKDPAGVCYGWDPYSNCNLINSVNLPAEPFRTSLSTDDIGTLMNNKRFTLIGFGDSITKGYRPGVKLEETFCSLLEKNLREKGVNAQVINIGKGGERTDQALGRLDEQVISRNPDMVLIMYGTNDSHIDIGKDKARLAIEEYEANLQKLIQKLKEANIQSLLMTEPRMTNSAKAKENEPYKRNDMNFMLRKYVAICGQIAAGEDVEFVDHFQYWSTSERSGQNLDEWLTDGVHPNPKGHEKMAEVILPVLMKTLGNKIY